MNDDRSGNGGGKQPSKESVAPDDEENKSDPASETEHQTTHPVVTGKQFINTENHQEKAPKPYRDWYDWLTLGLIVVGGILAAVAVIFTRLELDATRDALIVSERAWLAPTDLVNSADFRENTFHEVNLIYRNTGKTPATKTNLVYKPLLIPTQMIRDREFVESRILEQIGGRDCRFIDPKEDGYVVFPSGSSNEIARVPVLAEWTKKILSQTHYLAVVGCFAYESFREPRHSSFCIFFDFGVPKEKFTSKDWIATRCPAYKEYAD